MQQRNDYYVEEDKGVDSMCLKMMNRFVLIFSGLVLLFFTCQAEVEAGVQNFETPKQNELQNVEFINGGFEDPNIYELDIMLAEGAQFTLQEALNRKYNRLHMSIVPGWETVPVDPADQSNRWAEYFDIIMRDFYGGVIETPPHEKEQYAELNAEVPGKLFQVVDTKPGQKVYWEFFHRGRLGVDVMDFMLNDVVITTASTDHTAWKRYYGVYMIPDGQEQTEFAFVSVSATGGSKSWGNYLDAIRLFTPAFLEIEKEVETSGTDWGGAYALPGETVTYQITITNTGEAETSRTLMTDVLPDGIEADLSSIRMSYTDAEGETEELSTAGLVSYDSVTDTLSIEAGIEIIDAVITDEITGAEIPNTDANGTRSIEKNAVLTIRFDAVITGEDILPGTLIRNQAKVYYNDLGFEKLNVNAQGEIEEDYNVSTIAEFRLRSRVGITVTKEIDQAEDRDQTFIFHIRHQAVAPDTGEKEFYLPVTVAAGQLSGIAELDKLRPGAYTVTELDSNWHYRLTDLAEQEQDETLIDLNNSWNPVFENQLDRAGWIAGNAQLTNQMSD